MKKCGNPHQKNSLKLPVTAETFDNSGRPDLTSEKYHSDPLAEHLTPFLLYLSASDSQLILNSTHMLSQHFFLVKRINFNQYSNKIL